MRAILIILEILLLCIGVLTLQPFDRGRTAKAYAALAASPTQENTIALQSIMREDRIADNTIRASIAVILIINTCGIVWLRKKKTAQQSGPAYPPQGVGSADP